MSSVSEENIYSEIQKKLFYIIPEKWDSIYLYASVVEMPKQRPTGEMYFYYFPKGIIKKKPVNCYEIPNAFNIDEDEYARLITELYNIIKKIREIWAKAGKKLWTNLTISIEKSKFKIEYDYQDLQNSEFDSYERHIIWRYVYLKPDWKLLSKPEKQIIEDYARFYDMTKPKKTVHTEKMYDEPVKNIVDFEKMLSVEEALARSGEEEISKKKKNHHFRKKKFIEEMAQIENEEEDFGNNQILNWKKKS